MTRIRIKKRVVHQNVHQDSFRLGYGLGWKEAEAELLLKLNKLQEEFDQLTLQKDMLDKNHRDVVVSLNHRHERMKTIIAGLVRLFLATPLRERPAFPDNLYDVMADMGFTDWLNEPVASHDPTTEGTKAWDDDIPFAAYMKHNEYLV